MKSFLGTLTAGILAAAFAVAILRGEYAVLFVLVYELSRALTYAWPEDRRAEG